MNVPLCLRAKGSYRVLSARLLYVKALWGWGKSYPYVAHVESVICVWNAKLLEKCHILNKVLKVALEAIQLNFRHQEYSRENIKWLLTNKEY